MSDNFAGLGAKWVKASPKAETEHERDAALLTDLLATVSDSVCRFRPSPSLADLPVGTSQTNEEIDLVVSGGGLKGYFLIGCRDVLDKQLKIRGLRIRRYAGASAGAWSAMFMAADVSTAHWLKTYTFTRAAMEAGDSSCVLEAYREQILPWLMDVLPPDAYLRCNGRCFLSITVLDKFGFFPRNVIVSEFSSNEDLINACFASSCIPFVVERALGPRFRGQRVVDGGLTNNTPCFVDGARRQIVIRLEHVLMDWRAIASPIDPCIEALALNGALMMARFLEGRDCGLIISWQGGEPHGIFYPLVEPLQRMWAAELVPSAAALVAAAVAFSLSRRHSALRNAARRRALVQLSALLAAMGVYLRRRSLDRLKL
jgi:hypothetical protein